MNFWWVLAIAVVLGLAWLALVGRALDWLFDRPVPPLWIYLPCAFVAAVVIAGPIAALVVGVIGRRLR